jgi:hypothetical protein
VTTPERDPQPEHGKVDDLGFALPEPARLSPTRAIAIGAGVVVVLGGAFLLSWLPRRRAHEALAVEAKRTVTEVQRVEVITPKVGSSDRSLGLPA